MITVSGCGAPPPSTDTPPPLPPPTRDRAPFTATGRCNNGDHWPASGCWHLPVSHLLSFLQVFKVTTARWYYARRNNKLLVEASNSGGLCVFFVFGKTVLNQGAVTRSWGQQEPSDLEWRNDNQTFLNSWYFWGCCSRTNVNCERLLLLLHIRSNT